MAQVKIESLAFPAETKKYIANVLDPILLEMIQELLLKSPEDPLKFVCEWLRQRGGIKATTNTRRSLQDENDFLNKELASCHQTVGELTGAAASAKSQEGGDEKEDKPQAEAESEEESEEDEAALKEAEEQALKAKAMHRGPRQSVSAEAYGDWNQIKSKSDAPVFEKTEEQKASLRKILQKSFLFQALTEPDMKIIIGAMEQKVFEPGARIITEGEDGDVARHVYIIEEGNPECKKLINGEQKKVKQCIPGDVFGELALLYNCPRAATVETPDRCLCWRLERETFNSVVREAAVTRTETYDKFLKEVPLLQGLGMSDRMMIIDALRQEEFKKDDEVIKQGDTAERFYIVQSGSFAAMKKVGDAEPRNVNEYSKGMFFGELALLRNKPREATVVVTSETAMVISLDRRSFMNLVGDTAGSVSDILNRQVDSFGRQVST